MVYCKCSQPIRGIRPVYWGMSTHLPATFGVLRATRVMATMGKGSIEQCSIVKSVKLWIVIIPNISD